MAGGTLFIVPRTPDALEAFWKVHRHEYAFAIEGADLTHGNWFLRSHEWVFGPDKANLVKTVWRWDQMGLQMRWYDWAKEDPDEYANVQAEMRAYRDMRIKAGKWTDQDEREHEQGLRARGYWRVENLPTYYELG